LFRPRERAFKQFKCPRPQSVKHREYQLGGLSMICCNQLLLRIWWQHNSSSSLFFNHKSTSHDFLERCHLYQHLC